MMARGPRALRRRRRLSPSTLGWLLTLLTVAGVGWFQLRQYEARIHLLHDGGADGGSQRAQQLGAGHGWQQKQERGSAADTAAQSGGERLAVSRRCAAQLTESGLLPDSRAGQGQEQGVEGAADMALADGGGGSNAAGAAVAFLRSRRRLYDAMESSLLDKGLELAASSTQGMGLSDLFTLEGGTLTPVLTALKVPVRAVVMPLTDKQASGKLAAAVRDHLAPLVAADGIWPQDSSLYHSTLYHASTHLDPVPASASEVNAEAEAILGVGRRSCPLHVVLERVVATASGTVLACWQVSEGTDPFLLRRQLAAALPHASKQQIVQDHSILHTTLARLVSSPRRLHAGSEDGAAAAGEAALVLQQAVDGMTRQLCGLQAVMDQIWFAEEADKLALALGGTFKHRVVPLACAPSQQ